MLAAGDELGHSQGGNNNAYCQDNATGWIDWAEADQALMGFVAGLLALRRRHPALRHEGWFHAHPGPGDGWVLRWLRPDGQPMQVEDWHDPHAHALAGVIEESGDTGIGGQEPSATHPASGSSQSPVLTPSPGPGFPPRDGLAWWIAFNPEEAPLDFSLPPGVWHHVVDSAAGLVTDPTVAQARPAAAASAVLSGRCCTVPPQSLMLACRVAA
jgi:pullulanase/glycogen debranching enzyme